MALTVVFEGLDLRRDVRVVADPLSELSMTLHAVMFGDHHGRARPLRENLHKGNHEEFFARSAYFQPLYGGTRARYFLPLADITDQVDIHDRIESIALLEPEVFARQSVVALIGVNKSLLELDVLRSDADRHYVLESVSRISRVRVELARDLLERPADTAKRLVDFLHDTTNDWFAEEWAKIGPRIRTERGERRQSLKAQGLKGIVEAMPSAIEFTDPHRIMIDKVNHSHVTARRQGIVLVPSYHIHPHLFVKDYEGYPVILAYSVEPTTFDSAKLTERRLAVLNDPARREICRAILRTPRTTSDLAARMRMTGPQMSRHLRALRETDLVTAERGGRFVFYSLNSRAIAMLGTQLLAQLHR